MNEKAKDALRAAVSDAGAAALLGIENAEAHAHMVTEIRTVEKDARPFRVTADGTPASLEGWLLQPVSVRAEVELYDVVGFGAYVNRFKGPSTLVFADERNGRFTAVIDYHDPVSGQGLAIGPQWLRNRAFLQLQHTDEWNEWLAQDGVEKAMSQEAFAQFLEDHIPQIAAPAGAKLVEMARNLEATVSGKFNSAIRANDGSVNFAYVKDVQATSTSVDGKVALPTEVQLMLKPYESLADRYQVVGKLRYRISGGRLALWFDLFGVDEAIEQAFGDLTAAVTAQVSPTVVLAGPAPKAQTAE